MHGGLRACEVGLAIVLKVDLVFIDDNPSIGPDAIITDEIEIFFVESEGSRNSERGSREKRGSELRQIVFDTSIRYSLLPRGVILYTPLDFRPEAREKGITLILCE